MITVTTLELEQDIDKYIELAKKEEIEVIQNGEVVFYFTPKRIKLSKECESLFGSMPREAYFDDDIDRE